MREFARGLFRVLAGLELAGRGGSQRGTHFFDDIGAGFWQAHLFKDIRPFRALVPWAKRLAMFPAVETLAAGLHSWRHRCRLELGFLFHCLLGCRVPTLDRKSVV